MQQISKLCCENIKQLLISNHINILIVYCFALGWRLCGKLFTRIQMVVGC